MDEHAEVPVDRAEDDPSEMEAGGDDGTAIDDDAEIDADIEIDLFRCGREVSMGYANLSSEQWALVLGSMTEEHSWAPWLERLAVSGRRT